MPVPATVPEFVDVVRRSGLVEDGRLQPELDRLAAAEPVNIDLVAVALVRAGLLTKFQARQLKLGRYKRFMIANKYRLLELIGVGGMGAVYLCEHVFMRRLVALKVLPLEKLADPSNLERFYREARAVAALDHPNIVRAYDIDKADGLHFLVMEYVDGASLQEIVARFGPLDPVRAANYIAQAAVGMQHGHALGMVHRDIKPGNLLLDRTGTVKLLDMGLARFFHDKTDNLTAKYDDNCVLGTADYLAPEQALSNEVDIRADLYALGGTLYFLLTGQPPVPDGTIAFKLMFHQQDQPKPVTAFRSDVPAGLLAVLEKLMRKKPGERYQLPIEVAEALAPWAELHVPPPPEHEMPDHCPAVLAAAGYAERGKVVAAAGAGRSSGYTRGLRGTGSIPAYVGNDPGSDPGRSAGSATGSVRLDEPTPQAQVPTGGRSSSTVPLNTPPVRPGLVPTDSSEVTVASPFAGRRPPSAPAVSRRALVIGGAITAAALAVAAAAAAALSLAGGRTDDPSPGRSAGPGLVAPTSDPSGR
jgi:serine/threonine protein kinase